MCFNLLCTPSPRHFFELQFLFVLSSLGGGCFWASHFGSQGHPEWAQNSPAINHTEYAGLPSRSLAPAVHIIAVFYDGKVLMTSRVRELLSWWLQREWRIRRRRDKSHWECKTGLLHRWELANRQNHPTELWVVKCKLLLCQFSAASGAKWLDFFHYEVF